MIALASALLIMVLAAPAGAVPPPPEETSVNCARPTYASDHLVCEDAELLALDNALRTRIGQQGDIAKASLWEPDYDWFRRRALCAREAEHRGCLTAAYLDRMATLDAAEGPIGAANWRALRCEGPWQGRAVRAAESGERLVVRDGPALLAVAAPSADRQGRYRPFVEYQRKGPTIVFRPVAGPTIRCRS